MKNLRLREGQSELTMSSREIEELTGKRHDNILRDIRGMLEELDIDPTSNLSYPLNQGVTVDLDEHTGRVKAYHLDRDLTDCLLTGYNAKARMAVIKRWRELEAGRAIPSQVLSSEERRLVMITELSILDAKDDLERRLAENVEEAENLKRQLKQLDDYGRTAVPGTTFAVGGRGLQMIPLQR